MRRESDIRSHNRSGRGRRARDRLAAGEPDSELYGQVSSELDNLLMFVADDLRESTLSLAGIEAHLVAVHRLLGEGALEPGEVDAAVGVDLDGRLDALADSLQSLQRRLQRLRAACGTPQPAVIARLATGR
jgi:hypothetical protein